MTVKKNVFTFLLIALFGVSPSLLLGQETASPSTPRIEPAELSSTWWSQVTKDSETLEQNFNDIITKVEPLPDTLSGENQKKAEVLVRDIKINLQNYLKIAEQTLPPSPVPGAIAESYSIEDLIRLNNSLVKNTIELSSRKEERNELQKSLNTLQERADFVWNQYSGAEARSEQRILLGLEVISLLPAVDASKRKLQILDKTITNTTQSLQFLREEIDAAIERLTFSPSQQTLFARQIDPNMRLWQEAKNQKQQMETAIEGKFSDETTEQAKAENQYLRQQRIKASLQEMEAHNRLLRTEILYTLGKVLNEPEETDHAAINLSLKDWFTLLSSFRASLSEWESQTRRMINRSTELLSLAEQTSEQGQTANTEQLRKNITIGQENLLSIQTLKKEIDDSEFLYKVLDERLAGIRGPGQRWLRLATDIIYDSLVAAMNSLGVTLFYIGVHPVTPLAILRFILIMIFTWWVARLLTATLDTVARGRKGIRKSVIYRINTLFRYMILLIGLLFALTSIGFDFSNLVLIAGALGIGIGFGLQNIFNNFISGIIILFQSHLKVGDFVELDTGLRGEIREINVRSTVITTNDGVDVIVPNSEMVSSRIVNWTLRDPYRRVHIPFSVAYGSDIDEVSKVVKEAAKKIPSTLQKIGVRDPQVYLQKFGDNALEMELVVWVNEKWTRRHRRTMSEYLWAIEKALRKHGFTIPFPQRDIHIKTVLDKKELEDLLKKDREL